MYFPRTRALREEFEYTQQFVADYLDCKRTTYESWETGHIILPLDVANKLAHLYNVPISYALGTDTIRFVGKQLENINEYVKRINNRVANSFNISKMIIDNDYYKYILNQ